MGEPYLLPNWKLHGQLMMTSFIQKEYNYKDREEMDSEEKSVKL